jgi:hypothetical protein
MSTHTSLRATSAAPAVVIMAGAFAAHLRFDLPPDLHEAPGWALAEGPVPVLGAIVRILLLIASTQIVLAAGATLVARRHRSWRWLAAVVQVGPAGSLGRGLAGVGLAASSMLGPVAPTTVVAARVRVDATDLTLRAVADGATDPLGLRLADARPAPAADPTTVELADPLVDAALPAVAHPTVPAPAPPPNWAAICATSGADCSPVQEREESRGQDLPDWRIEAGQHLWHVAEKTVLDAEGTAPVARVAEYHRRLVAHTTCTLPVPDNPDLVFVGTVVRRPPLNTP